jgi:hypothetical protein
MRTRSICGALLAVGLSGAIAHAQAPPLPFLKKVGFTDEELASFNKGAVITKILPTKEDLDAAVIGAVRIGASPETLIDKVRTLEAFRKGATVLQIGRFSSPPKIEDLAGLTIDESELKDFEECKVGSCDLKLGAGAMELAKKVDWKAPDAHAKATALLKQAIVEGANAYVDKGAMGLYVDNAAPEPVVEGIQKILADSPYLVQYDAGFGKFVLEFPKTSLPGAESVFYWSKDKLRKPVVSLHHLVIYKRGQGAAATYFLADKHVYDSHYFLATVDFIGIVPDAEPGKGFSLVYLTRTRIDPPQHFRGTLLGKIKGGMKDAITDKLTNGKKRLEAPAGAPQ